MFSLAMSVGKSDFDIEQEIAKSKESCSNGIDSESKEEENENPPIKSFGTNLIPYSSEYCI